LRVDLVLLYCTAPRSTVIMALYKYRILLFILLMLRLVFRNTIMGWII